MVVLELCHNVTIKELLFYRSSTFLLLTLENSRNTPLHTWNSAYGQTYSPHTHVQTQRQTYKHGVNEARLSSVMTPVLAWQDVYTHNHGRASDVGWDEGEMRREEKEEAETWRWASATDCFSLSDRRTVVTVPHWELRGRQRETQRDRSTTERQSSEPAGKCSEKERLFSLAVSELNHILQSGGKQLDPPASPWPAV